MLRTRWCSRVCGREARWGPPGSPVRSAAVVPAAQCKAAGVCVGVGAGGGGDGGAGAAQLSRGAACWTEPPAACTT